MASVENRIVRMEFDNAAFEAKVSKTLASLAQLDKALKLEGAKKGLTDVADASRRFNLNPLNTAVQSVSAGFLALSTIAVTALSTITHAAITSGARIVKALTIQPVLDGWQEFETNVGSIQTILANTKADNTGLDDVNAALDTLNEYSDKTIYNFGQMARNIGTFTAAGVDLQTSVDSIKGISNLAAISGSSAEQAATAMYQLSQAVSTGTLRLMDWNSVVNAGMGGEVFQKALFDTGVAMQTITGVPMGTTFEEWTAAGNSFRDSLQEGWLTSEVLTTTLRQFTGEMTEAQLLSIGFTKEQAAAILELGQTGVEAATKIRTLSGLITTIKETIGSGWSQTFRTVIGDFEESTELFTSINDAISEFVNKQADARNELLQGWKDLGGRDLLIKSLADAFKALAAIVKPIRDAFRDIFPPVTAERLFELTQRFSEFVKTLKPSETTINNVKRIFTGLFSALDVGWEIIKAGVGFFKDLIVSITGIGSGGILEFTADIADFFTRLRDGMDEGAAIHEFFDRLSESLEKPIQFIKDLKDAFLGLFDGFDNDKAGEAEGSINRFGQRVEQLGGIFERLGDLWQPLQNALNRVLDILEVVGEAISDWFSELGDKLAEAMGPGDFDAVLDAFNVGLLAGIALLLKKFLSGGLNLDFGGGLFSKISGAFEQLTGVLEAMQTQIRADALLKIAGAVGILTASVVALSLIDSAALTRALTAMAVGFGQLMAAFVVINSMNVDVLSGVKFTAIATGMIVMATALLVLAGAVAIFSRFSWSELAKGLAGITVSLTVLTAAAIVISKNVGSMFLASLGITAMAVALNIMALAVKSFAEMDWTTMARGMSGAAVALGVLVAAAVLISKHAPSMLISSIGIAAMAVALNIMALAVKSFAEMEWAELAKGMTAAGVGLGILVAAAVLISKHVGSMLAASIGLIAMSVALNIMALAVKSFAEMDWGEIAKGLAAMAGALFILAIAAAALQHSVGGAFAMLVVSAALAVLGKTLIEISKVPFGDLLKGIGAITIALAAFGVVASLLSSAVLPMIGMGVALLFIGGAFALFGVGALGVAKAFEILAKAGPDAADAITAAIEAIGKALPTLARGLAEGILELIQTFTDAAPVIAKGLTTLLEHLLQTIVDILPLLGEVITGLVGLLIDVFKDATPDIVEAGIGFVMALLDGIEQNIEEITETVLNIIEAFLNAVADNIEDITDAGVDVLVAFLAGLAGGADEILTAVGNLISTFVLGVGNLANTVITAGLQLLLNFLKGITNNLILIANTVTTMITTFITAMGSNATRIATAGTNALIKFLSGITNNLVKITNTVGTMVTTFINAVTNQGQRIVTTGANAIIRFVQGLGQNASRVVAAGVTVVIKFMEGIARQALRLARAAFDVVITFLNSLAEVIRQKSGELRAAGLNIATAIIDGITGGIASKVASVASGFVDMARSAVGSVTSFLGIGSPSKVFWEIGEQSVEGFAIGLSKIRPVERSAQALGDAAVSSIKDVLNKVAIDMSNMEAFNPTITPVLDLTQVESEASRLAGLIPDSSGFAPTVSFNRAQQIATSRNPTVDQLSTESSETRQVTFEQNIYAPEQLSTGDIYKHTRNQITLAKEELSVP